MTSSVRRVFLSALLLFAMAGGLSSAAFAQATQIKTTAKQLVSEGLAAQVAGRFDEAIALYNKAYELVPHPELLFNLGQAYRLKGDKVTALDYYLKYLAVDTKGRAASEAAEWASQLEREIREEKAAAPRVEKESAASPRGTGLDRGQVAAKTGSEELPTHLGQAQQPQAASGSDSPPPASPPSSRPGIITLKRGIAIGLGVGALAALYQSLDYRSLGDASYDNYRYSRKPGFPEEVSEFYLREANKHADRSLIFFIATVTLAGASGYLWFTGGPDRDSKSIKTTRVTPVVKPELTGVFFSGGF